MPYKNIKDKNVASNAWARRNRNKANTANKKYNAKYPEKYLYRVCKKRAKKREIFFELLPEDIHIPNYCPVLGIPLYFSEGHASYNSPSIDRIDNNKGYTKDNICVISYRANILKNNGTLEEFEAIIRYIKEYI